jgi:hypothetical protein
VNRRDPSKALLDRSDPQYLRLRYGHTFKVGRDEDGVWTIRLRYPDRDGLHFEISVHDQTRLAACVPPKAGASLLRRFPAVFELARESSDARVLLFDENLLEQLAGPLRIRTRRRVSTEERARLRSLSREHSPGGLERILASRTQSGREN